MMVSLVAMVPIVVFLSLSTLSQGNLECTIAMDCTTDRVTAIITEYEAILDSWWNRSHEIPHINHKEYIRAVADFVSITKRKKNNH